MFGRNLLDYCRRQVIAQTDEIAVKQFALRIVILENKGLWEFDCLTDCNGNFVSGSLVETAFGPAWLLPGGAWQNNSVQNKTLIKKGLKRGKIMHAAWVSCATTQPYIYPSKRNFWTGKMVWSRQRGL